MTSWLSRIMLMKSNNINWSFKNPSLKFDMFIIQYAEQFLDQVRPMYIYPNNIKESGFECLSVSFDVKEKKLRDYLYKMVTMH